MEEECDADVKEVQHPSVFQCGFDNDTQNFNRHLCRGGGKQKAMTAGEFSQIVICGDKPEKCD